MTFELQHTDNASDARTGIITTDHGQIKTPIFTVSYTHLRAHETDQYLVCRLLLEKKKH